MITVDDLWSAVENVQGGALSIDDFQRWLRKGSYNFHASGNQNLIDAIFAVEAVLSEYSFADMGDDLTKRGLVIAIRPFLSRRVYVDPIGVTAGRPLVSAASANSSVPLDARAA